MRFFRNISVMVSVLLLASVSAFAQGTTGTLTGTVTGEGSAMPGAAVTISSPNLLGTRTAVTDINGVYNFGALPPGDYTVKFELEGMSEVTRTVHISPAQGSRSDADMKLSALGEAITVTASAPAVLETTEVQTTLKADLIESLPIARTIQGTVSLAPGVTQNGPGGAIAISGGQSFDNVFYINGSVVNEVLRGQPLSTYIEDAIQETTVLTGAISAEYGRFTGGVVSSVTKSGGNEFSGSFRDSFTNSAWTSQTPLEEPKADSDLNETYEATLGGRIIRDRLWFFGAGRYQDRNTQNTYFDSTDTFVSGSEEKRYEAKLTGQITPKHSLAGSYIFLDRSDTDSPFGDTYEESSLDDFGREQTSQSLHYNGILSSNFLLEANYAESEVRFIGDGGARADFAHGSNVYDANTGAFLGAPTFGESEFGADNYRASNDYLLKGTYYLATAGAGTHNLVAGYDRFTDILHENNAQSGSDFTIYTYAPVNRGTNGQVQPVFETGNALIIWWPILEGTRGTDFLTESYFVNDKWDFNNKLSFNIGVRYDANDATNSQGLPVANDSRVSPRLAVNYDTFGDGKLRFNASYNEYVAKVANGNVGDSTSSAGAPSILYWLYYGPEISGLSTVDALQEMYDWFQSTGGTDNRNFFDGETGFLLGGGTNGVQTQIRESLKSPYVTEYTFGVGSQIGSNGFVRVDFQDREWGDFYVTELTLDNGTVYDDLAQADLDLGLLTNANDLERTYRAMIVQAGFRPWTRVNIGANYTWSELEGNIVGETSGSGPISSTGTNYYPELLNYAQRNPVGFLPDDQEHKARLWIGYDQPLGMFGSLNISLLERFDSGRSYSAVGTITTVKSGGASGCATCNANPGYVSFSTSGNSYYFSKRGAYRFDDISATDLALNWNLPISQVELYIQADLRNAFDESAQLGANTTVLTSRSGSCIQNTGANVGKRCASFNPFTDTPVEGINYRLGSRFGQATDTGHYQLPRTYLFSAGVKF